MAKYYSRLSHVSRQQNIKTGLKYTTGTIVLLFSLLLFGIPAATRVSSFITNLRGSPIVSGDNIAPPSPDINELPSFTNKDQLIIEGSTEPGANVVISINKKELQTIAGNDGGFSQTIKLDQAQNEVYAFAKDQSGNTSPKSKVFNVVYDTKPPELLISSPADGSIFYLDKNKNINVQGKTEVNTYVSANNKPAQVLDDGSFRIDLTLTEGENIIDIVSTDQAGNESSASISVTFRP